VLNNTDGAFVPDPAGPVTGSPGIAAGAEDAASAGRGAQKKPDAK